MNKPKKLPRVLSVAAIATMLVMTTSVASLMSGCGCDNETAGTKPVINNTATTVAAEQTTVVNEKSENEVNENSEITTTSAQSSNEKSESSENSQQENSSNEKPESSETSSKAESSDNSSSVVSDVNTDEGICNVDGKKYEVGSKVTSTYYLTSPVVLVNYQGNIEYDSKYLKITSARLAEKSAPSGMVNYANLNNEITFIGSVLSGYDYTKEDKFLTVTYEVLKEGTTSTRYNWQNASELLSDYTLKSYVTDGKPAAGLKIRQELS